MSTKQKHIYILHGPNLNLLGSREVDIYGAETLDNINQMLAQHAEKLGVTVSCKQSNHEGDLVTWLQEAQKNADGVVLNVAGYTHTSVAIRDAASACKKPIIEVHLSNIHAREPFRHQSLIAPVVQGSIIGLGPRGYALALGAIVDMLRDNHSN